MELENKNNKKQFLSKAILSTIVLLVISVFLFVFYVYADLYDSSYIPSGGTNNVYTGDDSISDSKGAIDYYDQHKDDLSAGQDKSEKRNNKADDELLFTYSDIRLMIKDMCNTNENLSEDDVFNSDAMINKMFSGMAGAIKEFNNSSVYTALTGIGILILLINFSFSFYQNMPNIERKTTEQILRMTIQFIVSIFIIANIGKFLNMAIGMAQFLLDKAVLLKNGEGNSSGGFSLEDEITLTILKAEGLDKHGILDKFLGMAKAMFIRVKLFLPWGICIISKVGIIFTICKISVETIVYAMFYPLAAGDCYENIKHSNFMKYTKHIFACLMQLAIIVLILYAANLLLADIIRDIANNLSKANKGEKIFEILILLTVIQLSKTVVVMSSTSVIAHKAFGE